MGRHKNNKESISNQRNPLWAWFMVAGWVWFFLAIVVIIYAWASFGGFAVSSLFDIGDLVSLGGFAALASWLIYLRWNWRKVEVDLKNPKESKVHGKIVLFCLGLGVVWPFLQDGLSIFPPTFQLTLKEAIRPAPSAWSDFNLNLRMDTIGLALGFLLGRRVAFKLTSGALFSTIVLTSLGVFLGEYVGQVLAANSYFGSQHTPQEAVFESYIKPLPVGGIFVLLAFSTLHILKRIGGLYPYKFDKIRSFLDSRDADAPERMVGPELLVLSVVVFGVSLYLQLKYYAFEPSFLLIALVFPLFLLLGWFILQRIRKKYPDQSRRHTSRIIVTASLCMACLILTLLVGPLSRAFTGESSTEPVLLDEMGIISNTEDLPAPQANMIAAVSEGLLDDPAKQPWVLYGLGGIMFVVLTMAGMSRLHAFIFLIGMYLGIERIFSVLVGSILHWLAVEAGDKKITSVRENLIRTAAICTAFGASFTGVVLSVLRIPGLGTPIQHISVGLEYGEVETFLGIKRIGAIRYVNHIYENWNLLAITSIAVPSLLLLGAILFASRKVRSN